VDSEISNPQDLQGSDSEAKLQPDSIFLGDFIDSTVSKLSVKVRTPLSPMLLCRTFHVTMVFIVEYPKGDITSECKGG
jgi:hypothetical protein